MRPLGFALLDVLRGLRRDRIYTATMILTLALAIGATTAMFSMVDGVLLPGSIPRLRSMRFVRSTTASPPPRPSGVIRCSSSRASGASRSRSPHSACSR